MKISILDDYHDTVRTLPCFAKLAGQVVTIHTDHVQDTDALAARLRDTEALVLIRERTKIRTPLLDRLPHLRLISQRSVYPHIEIETCTRLGIIVSSGQHADTPSYATAELAFGLILSAMRQIPQQMAALQSGQWQIGIGHHVAPQKRSAFTATAGIGSVVAGYGLRLRDVRPGLERARQPPRRVPPPTATRRLPTAGRVLPTRRHRFAAHAPGRRHSGNRHRRGPRPHETLRAARQHQAAPD